MNAYIQRQPSKLSFDSSLPPSEGLDVLYRAMDDEPVVSRITQNRKFLVPSRTEETVLLEAEAGARQKRRAGKRVVHIAIIT
jgi:cytochrome c biogenesis protein ResB